jgi:hypothetical protein
MAKVFVALPIFNLINPDVQENHRNILSNSVHSIIFSKIVGASVEHARQILIDRFLETDCDYLFNLDADILFLEQKDILDRLISLDKPIIGGIYVYKKKPCLPVYRPLDLQKRWEIEKIFPDNYKFDIPPEPFEIKWLGNGCKLIKREVVEVVKKQIKCPNLPMLYKDEYLSEDFAFDQRARELGYTVWADPSIKLGHVGSYTYKLADYDGIGR